MGPAIAGEVPKTQPTVSVSAPGATVAQEVSAADLAATYGVTEAVVLKAAPDDKRQLLLASMPDPIKTAYAALKPQERVDLAQGFRQFLADHYFINGIETVYRGAMRDLSRDRKDGKLDEAAYQRYVNFFESIRHTDAAHRRVLLHLMWADQESLSQE